MKLTNFAVVAVLLLLPLFVFNNWHVLGQKEALHLETRYNAAITSAVQDGAQALTFNEKPEFEAGYGSVKKYRANKEAALDTFLHTLYLNFNAEDAVTQGTLMKYIPLVAVVDFDGYYLYEPKPYFNGTETEYRHVFSEKKPYVYLDADGNNIGFTLDDTVQVYDRAHNRWEEGRLEDVEKKLNREYYVDSQNALLSPAMHEWVLQRQAGNNLFDNIRRTTIIQALQQDVETEINRYNTYSQQQGITYTFTLPTIDQEQWNNTVDDIGLLAFIQGIPMGDKTYNNYALGGSRIVKREALVGVREVITRNPDGTVVYGNRMYSFRESCLPQFDMTNYDRTETFTTEKEAASKGYRPWDCK
ncbi:hypothetical protein [Tumebacillus permanentifrigoris]|uniref:F0F1-type ATP synthase n=1 Tax=Tumebacillus permanentifrigoris TaxID=378543 RepID=A0A316D4M0_9BACL|nr:hypothetical protein [Tumebacillus permanentifrigoris]PWK05005.1 hypothetical protein C7459_1293 [Tumebacillus permanentifrigoris]